MWSLEPKNSILTQVEILTWGEEGQLCYHSSFGARVLLLLFFKGSKGTYPQINLKKKNLLRNQVCLGGENDLCGKLKMQIYIRSKSAQSHLKKSAFKDADKIRSDSTNKNQHDLGKLMFFSLTILPLPPPQSGGRGRNPFPKALKHLFYSRVNTGLSA